MSLLASAVTIFTATYAGRWGDYVATFYSNVDAAPGTVPALRMAAPPDAVCAEVSRAFGGGLMPWSVDYALVDPDGIVDDYFGGDFDPADYAVRLSGPDGLGGTWTVWTRPMRGEVDHPASPLTAAGDPVVLLGTHDGLATLEDVDGANVSERPLSDVLARLWFAMPGRADDADTDWWDVWAALPVTFPEAKDALLSSVRLTGEVAGDPERGDYGRVSEQLRALAEAFTLSVYQPTDAPAAEPRWEAVTRSRVGLTDTGTAVESDGSGGATTAAATLPARTSALPSRSSDRSRRAAGRVRRAGTVTLAGRAPVSVAVAGREMAADTTETVRVGRFSATPGLRFRQTVTQSGGEVRLRLTPSAGGAARYGPAWSTTPGPAGTVTTADLPADGVVEVVLVAETTASGGGSPTTVTAGEVTLEDAYGARVTDYAVRIGDPGGEPVEVALLPPLEANTAGTTWAAVTRYALDLTGTEEADVADASAATRAAQQAVNLRALEAEVTGIHGPQARFTLAGSVDSANADSPFAEDVALVVVGAEPDLRRGTTRVALVAATETPPA